MASATKSQPPMGTPTPAYASGLSHGPVPGRASGRSNLGHDIGRARSKDEEIPELSKLRGPATASAISVKEFEDSQSEAEERKDAVRDLK